MLFTCCIRIWKGLDNGVICQGNGLMPPFFCLFNKSTDASDSIHLAHWRMQMKLNTLFSLRCSIFFQLRFHFIDVISDHDKISHKRIVLNASSCFDPHPFFQGFHELSIFFFSRKHFDQNTIRIIGNFKDTKGSAAF